MAFSDEFPGSSLDGAWTARNASGGSSVTVANGQLTITAPSGSGGIEGVSRSAGSAPWIHTTRMAGHAAGNYGVFAFGLRDSAGAIEFIGWVHSGGIGTVFMDQFSSYTSFSAAPASIDKIVPGFLRIEDDATNLVFSWSLDGVTWTGGVLGGVLRTEARASFLNGGTYEIFLMVSPSGGDVQAVFDWIRSGSDVSDPPGGGGGALLRTGSGVPSDGLGADDDTYIDTATGNLYLRAAGTYSLAVALGVGTPGADGADGADGAAGPPGANTMIGRTSFDRGEVPRIYVPSFQGPSGPVTTDTDCEITIISPAGGSPIVENVAGHVSRDATSKVWTTPVITSYADTAPRIWTWTAISKTSGSQTAGTSAVQGSFEWGGGAIAERLRLALQAICQGSNIIDLGAKTQTIKDTLTGAAISTRDMKVSEGGALTIGRLEATDVLVLEPSE